MLARIIRVGADVKHTTTDLTDILDQRRGDYCIG